MASILFKVVRICNAQLKCNYLKIQNFFSQFFIPFLRSTSNFKDFGKNMMVTANVFPKLETVKILVRPLSKKQRFRTRFDSEHVKASIKSSEISMKVL